MAIPSSCHSLVGTWARLQEELLHWRLTPMQKHLRQPSGFCLLRWKKPSEHSLHKRPTTLFCGHRIMSCRMAPRRRCLELAAESTHGLDGGPRAPWKTHMYEVSPPPAQSPPDHGCLWKSRSLFSLAKRLTNKDLKQSKSIELTTMTTYDGEFHVPCKCLFSHLTQLALEP